MFENKNHEILFFILIRHLNIYLNKDFHDIDDKMLEKLFANNIIYIKKIININFKLICFIRRLYLTRVELKIIHFDREYIENYFVVIRFSFFHLLFIDDFEIHRNMYRVLKNFYFIFVNFQYYERRKIVNIFIVILESYNIAFKNVVDTITKFIKQLNKNINLIINNQKIYVCVFILRFIENIL